MLGRRIKSTLVVKNRPVPFFGDFLLSWPLECRAVVSCSGGQKFANQATVMDFRGGRIPAKQEKMPYGTYISAAGANAQNHRLQVLSNNLANVQTAGYKPQQAVMQSRFAELIERGETPPGTGGADDIGGGVTVQPAVTQYGEGILRQTKGETDFAISDKESFFVVRRGDQQLLTRAGNFLFDSNGRLITQQGDAVLDAGGRQVAIDPTLPFSVLNGGRIQQGDAQFSLMLARPTDLDQLKHLGGNLFQAPEEFDLVRGLDRPVVSGFIEQSAVQPTMAMMELIEASRAYEANARMIQNHDSTVGSLISRVLQG